MNPNLCRHLTLWLLTLSLFVCSGCPPPKSSKVPDEMYYVSDDLRLWATVAIQPNSPSTNFTATSYEIDPLLPAGLGIDSGTGTISGTATVVSPRTSYTVTARHGTDVLDTTGVVIEVFDGVAPGTLTYTPSAALVPQYSALPNMDAQYAGTAEGFSVVPPLPTGLSINPDDGTIYGVCNGPLGLTQHLVSVWNPLGGADANVQIEVTDPLLVNGVLVPSQGERSLDVYVDRGLGVMPIDAEHFSGASPVAVAAAPNGRFIYASASNGKLYLVERNPLTGFCAAPVELAQTSGVFKLVVTADGRYLIAALDLAVARYEIQPDGSLCCGVQEQGPFGPTAILAATTNRLLLSSTLPGRVWCYDIEPVFALRGPPTDLGPDLYINQLVNSAPGSRIVALGSTYNFNTHQLSGDIFDLKLSTNGEIAGGALAVTQTSHLVNIGENLSDGCVELAGLGRLLVTDEARGKLYSFDFLTDGSLDTTSLDTHSIGGNPSGILRNPGGLGTLILDRTLSEITHYGTSPLTSSPYTRFRTRSFPLGMIALNGAQPLISADTAFVTSAADSTLLAVRGNPASPASNTLIVSAQGPVATGTHPLAVVASQSAPYVYTANRDDASISVFRFDAASLQLTLVETEALGLGPQLLDLAITPGGNFLYALDATGSVLALKIDPGDGSLQQSGSGSIGGPMAGAFLRMDPLARFVFVVQPAFGRVTSMTLALPSGTPTAQVATLNSLTDPSDLLPSYDGRFVSVLDRQQASVHVFVLDGLDGHLTPTMSTISSGTAPTRLIYDRAIPIVEPFPEEQLHVVDPSVNLTRSIERKQLLGTLHAGSMLGTQLVNNTQQLCALNFALHFNAKLGTSDDGQNPRLSLYDFNQAHDAVVETDFTALGGGPHAIATTIRVVAN